MCSCTYLQYGHCSSRLIYIFYFRTPVSLSPTIQSSKINFPDKICTHNIICRSQIISIVSTTISFIVIFGGSHTVYTFVTELVIYSFYKVDDCVKLCCTLFEIRNAVGSQTFAQGRDNSQGSYKGVLWHGGGDNNRCCLTADNEN